MSYVHKNFKISPTSFNVLCKHQNKCKFFSNLMVFSQYHTLQDCVYWIKSKDNLDFLTFLDSSSSSLLTKEPINQLHVLHTFLLVWKTMLPPYIYCTTIDTHVVRTYACRVTQFQRWNRRVCVLSTCHSRRHYWIRIKWIKPSLHEQKRGYLT